VAELLDLRVGHALDLLRELPAESVHCVVTSIPYWGLRAYAGLTAYVWGGRSDCPHEWSDELPRVGNEHRDGLGANSTFAGRADKAAVRESFRRDDAECAVKSTGGQHCRLCGAWRGHFGSEPLHDCGAHGRRALLGFEQKPDFDWDDTAQMWVPVGQSWQPVFGPPEPPCPTCYVCHVRTIWAALWRVLRDDGVCFLNIGDSYAGTGSGAGTGNFAEKNNPQAWTPNGKRAPDLKPKGMCLIPQRLALALDADGWWVRNEIIWHKKSAMPESASDRCTRNHEQIWLLAKSESYFWDQVAVRERGNLPAGTRGGKASAARAGADGVNSRPTEYAESTGSRNLRTVWTLKPEPCDWAYCRGCDTLFLGSDRDGIRQYCADCGKPWPKPRRKEYVPKHCAACGSDKRIQECPVCKRTDAWVAHYAAFPSGLPRRCIRAATSERGVCPKCGKQWERVVNKTLEPQYETRHGGFSARGDRAGMVDMSKTWKPGTTAVSTLGFRPTCGCHKRKPLHTWGRGPEPDPPAPATVLDPFNGTGTTTIVARQLGRRAIGFDAGADYVAVARKRCAVLGERATQPVPAGEMPLFQHALKGEKK